MITNNPCVNCKYFKRVSNYEWGVGFCSYKGICINGSQKEIDSHEK